MQRKEFEAGCYDLLRLSETPGHQLNDLLKGWFLRDLSQLGGVGCLCASPRIVIVQGLVAAQQAPSVNLEPWDHQESRICNAFILRPEITYSCIYGSPTLCFTIERPDGSRVNERKVAERIIEMKGRAQFTTIVTLMEHPQNPFETTFVINLCDTGALSIAFDKEESSQQIPKGIALLRWMHFITPCISLFSSEEQSQIEKFLAEISSQDKKYRSKYQRNPRGN